MFVVIRPLSPQSAFAWIPSTAPLVKAPAGGNNPMNAFFSRLSSGKLSFPYPEG
jgi:hypothetical protein